MQPAKKIIIIGLIMLSLLTTSCWNSRELNELAFVSAIAIDQGSEPETVDLTLQIFKPAEMQSDNEQGSGSSGSKPYYNVTATGQTVFEAIRKVSHMIDRRPYFQHLQVIIFSEEIAKTGLAQYLDLLTRDVEFRRTSFVLICKDKAKDVLDAKTELTKTPGDSFEHMIKKSANASLAVGINLLEFGQRLMTESTAPLASYLEFNSEDKSVRLTGAAIFKEDMLCSILNEKETRGLLWLIDKIKAGISVVKCPNPDCPKPDGKVSLEIINSRTDLKPEIKNDQAQFHVKIHPRIRFGEQTCPCDLSTPDKIEDLKNYLIEEITQEINIALKKSREVNCDIFGFGEKIWQRYPKYWCDHATKWEEEFPEIPLEIEVHTHLEETGMSIKPMRSLKK